VLPFTVLSSELGERCRDLGKIFDVHAKEIAETQELPDFGHGSAGLGVADGLEFVGSWFDSVLGESKAKVRDVVSPKLAFWEVDLDSVGVQTFKHLV
jgi:hypothetical protein